MDCEGAVSVINARGKIKYAGEALIAGDYVEVENGAIKSVYPRSSRISRPNVANLEMINAVISFPPRPDFLLIDKLLLAANYSNIEVILTVNKNDLGADTYNRLCSEYAETKIKIFSVSAKTGEGLDLLKNYISGKAVAFAGQSAVGKTSLTNAILGCDYKTGELSQKSERGRHTTTYTQIIRKDKFIIYDTPGFSELIADVPLSDAANNFLPYGDYADKCRFSDCSHTDDPDCAVVKAVAEKLLSKERHERYITIMKQLRENAVFRRNNNK